MKEIGGKVDINDLEYIHKRYGSPLAVIPAPVTKFHKDSPFYGKLKINPHLTRFIYKNGKEFIYNDVFHIKPIYYLHKNGEWRPLYEVASYYGNKRGMTLKQGWEQKINFNYLLWYMERLKAMNSKYGVAIEYPTTYMGIKISSLNLPLVLNATCPTIGTDCFPDPGTGGGNTSVDGIVYRTGVNESWASIRGGAGSAAEDTTSGNVQLGDLTSTTTTDQYSQLVRGIFLWDTSSYDDGITIGSATVSLYNPIASSDNFSLSVNLVNSTPASNGALVAADYGQLGTTLQSDTQTTFAAWWTGAAGYRDLVLNATGRGNVSLTGATKFGTRFDKDTTNTTPTWVSAVNGTAYADHADAAGTSKDPKLNATAAVAITALSNLLTLKVG